MKYLLIPIIAAAVLLIGAWIGDLVETQHVIVKRHSQTIDNVLRDTK